jgi:hypothetical protein
VVIQDHRVLQVYKAQQGHKELQDPKVYKVQVLLLVLILLTVVRTEELIEH